MMSSDEAASRLGVPVSDLEVIYNETMAAILPVWRASPEYQTREQSPEHRAREKARRASRRR